MKYLSVCSGIEAATQAWHPLGWEPVAFSEIEPFPCKVLAHHYPDVTNLGDMTKFKEWPDYANVDVLVGGTPCQSFSVAGLRKGLNDPRGNLMLTYLAIAAKYRPRWLVWENVPGVLSSNGGNDFASLLRGLGECGYGFAYRVLDAQFVRTDGYAYAVPQRRRRVFVVGCLGDWRRAAAVLFDSESLRGNPAPGRKARESVAGTIGARTGCSIGVQDAMNGHMLPVAPTLDAHYGNKMGLDNQHINSGGGCSFVAKTLVTKTRLDAETETLIPTIGGHFVEPLMFDTQQITSASNRSRVEAGLPCSTLNKSGNVCIALAGNTIGRKPENGGNGNGFDDTGSSYTLTKTDVHAVCLPINTQIATRHEAMGEGTGMGIGADGDAAYTLQAAHSHAVGYVGHVDYENNGYEMDEVGGPLMKGSPTSGGRPLPAVATAMQVRRLTPRECERLQGFPDDFTDIPGASDTTRYKALGNSMAVNVMQIIGQRIQMMEEMAQMEITA